MRMLSKGVSVTRGILVQDLVREVESTAMD